MIALQNASVRFGDVVALDAFTGSFPAGSVTALIGGDGAGKSTLLGVLAGRVTPEPAQHALPTDRREIGYQPATAGVWRNLSVDENIAFVARVYGEYDERLRERADHLLRRAGLHHARDRVAGRLSGGMRQKLAFVLATLHEPQLVLLDEPTTGVDPVSRGELWCLIAGAAADGATVVLATTYLDEAERAAQLFLLGDGRLLASGTADEVKAQTPGRLWRAPAGLARHGADASTLMSPDAWRSGADIRLWTPDEAASAPPGFVTAEPDLESTSIALLLAGENAAGARAQSDIGAGQARQYRDHALPAAPARTRPIVQAHEVARSYGPVRALRNVSLEVAAGEIVGLLGGNGAGKTTLMRVVLGLETADAGSCSLFGVAPSLDGRRRIGYVSQGLGLYPALSAIANLRFAAAVHGVHVSRHAQEFARDLGSTPVGRLPLGTQRILAYLAASQHEPELLILDEPTSGMDALARARLWKDLRGAADSGIGVLVTTHYMQEAAQCDRLVILTAGEVTGAGTEDQITAERTSLVVRCARWDEAFRLLTEKGIPVMLDGRALRLPGVAHEDIVAALSPMAADYQLTESRSTLEETMMLAAARDGAAM